MRKPETPEECKEYYKKLGDGIKMAFSEDRRYRTSEAHKGKKLSEETKRKISEKLRGRISPMFGKHHTEEAKRKMSVSCKGKHQLHPRSKKPLREPTSEELVWFFFNNCRAAKRYPKQKFEIIRVCRPGRPVCCSVCGETTISYGSVFAREIVCRNCREKELEKIMKADIHETRKKSVALASKFESELENCEKLGTCDIIRAHHEALIEDPDRLTSEFLIKMICGDAKVERYKDLTGIS